MLAYPKEIVDLTKDITNKNPEDIKKEVDKVETPEKKMIQSTPKPEEARIEF